MGTTSQGAWSEGSDGDSCVYRERLWPSPVVVLVALGLATLVGVAYGGAYGAGLGSLVGGALAAALLGLLIVTSPLIRVDNQVIRAGRARLPLQVVGAVTGLTTAEMQHQRRHIDPRSYLMLRAWSTRKGALITVEDARDPHPQWLISTRHPDHFVAAVHGARESSRATHLP